MADVRGASGVPGLNAFGGFGTPTPSTPLYVDLATGDLYVVISEVVTLVGAIPGGSGYIIGNQVMANHAPARTDLADVNSQLSNHVFRQQTVTVDDLANAPEQLANRTFRQRDDEPFAVIGDSVNILMQQVFSPRQKPAAWS